MGRRLPRGPVHPESECGSRRNVASHLFRLAFLNKICPRYGINPYEAGEALPLARVSFAQRASRRMRGPERARRTVRARPAPRRGGDEADSLRLPVVNASIRNPRSVACDGQLPGSSDGGQRPGDHAGSSMDRRGQRSTHYVRGQGHGRRATGAHARQALDSARIWDGESAGGGSRRSGPLQDRRRVATASADVEQRRRSSRTQHHIDAHRRPTPGSDLRINDDVPLPLPPWKIAMPSPLTAFEIHRARARAGEKERKRTYGTRMREGKVDNGKRRRKKLTEMSRPRRARQPKAVSTVSPASVHNAFDAAFFPDTPLSCGRCEQCPY